MKNPFRTIRRLFRCTYRLTVYYHGSSKPSNSYSVSRRLLRGMSRNISDYYFWTLYQSGPFGLPEHIIDSSCFHDKDKSNKK